MLKEEIGYFLENGIENFDFFYGDYWLELEAQGQLRLDLAFSRDQEYKIYVQHKMIEKGADLFAWLQKVLIYMFAVMLNTWPRMWKLLYIKLCNSMEK